MRAFLYTIFLFSFLNCTILQKIFMKKDPEFKIHSVKLEQVTLNGFIIKLDTELFNYYKFGLPKSKLNFDIKVNENLLTNYSSDEFQVAAESSVLIPIYLNFKYLDIAKVFKEFATSESLKLNLEGAVNFPLNIPGLPEKIFVPFRVERTIPSFIPYVEIEDISIQLENTKFQDLLVGNTKLKLNLKVAVENKGGSNFSLIAKDTYFKLDNQNLINISSRDYQERLKKQNLDFSSEIVLTDTFKSLFQSLTSNKKLQYNFESKLKFQFSNLDLNEFEIPVQYKGSFIPKN